MIVMKVLSDKFYPALILVSFISCVHKDPVDLIGQDKGLVLKTEKEFESMVADSGMAVAFAHFADEQGVIQRRDSIIKGKKAIYNYHFKSPLKNVKLNWEASFVDVSGDLAYTYGPYTFSAVDSSGNPILDNGIFHTVWKRQQDGTWRYVWD